VIVVGNKNIFIPTIKQVSVRSEGAHVQLIQGGILLLELPWQAAQELGKAIRFQAARSEQSTKIDKVADDQAVFIRAGFPIALTSRPDVFKEAGNRAAHDRELRRAMPGGVPSGVVFGRPSLRDKPRVGRIGASGIPSGEVFGIIGGK
jgi:hypothetical protein